MPGPTTGTQQAAQGVLNRLPVTLAFKLLLETGTGRSVGVLRAPPSLTDENVHAEPPYCIIYPLPGGNFLGGSAFYHPEEEATVEYQVTSVALRDDQAEWMGDQVRQSVLGRDLSGNFVIDMALPTGMTVTSREPSGPPGGVTREDILYQVAESYFIRVSVA